MAPQKHPPTNKNPADLNFCHHILSHFLASNHAEFAEPFLYPVDPIEDNAPDYLDIIDKPMDLSTISRKLKDGEYGSSQGFVADFALMFGNCAECNEEGSAVYEMGKAFERAFYLEWSEKEGFVRTGCSSHKRTTFTSKNDGDGDSDDDMADETGDDEDDQLSEDFDDDSDNDGYGSLDDSSYSDDQSSIAGSPTNSSINSNASKASNPKDEEDVSNTSNHPKQVTAMTTPPAQEPRMETEQTNPANSLQTLVQNLITQEIKSMTQHLKSTLAETEHSNIITLLWSNERGKQAVRLWKQRAVQKVEMMVFKDVVAGVRGQVKEAFVEVTRERGEVLRERGEVLREDVERGVEGLVGFVGEDEGEG